jgi:hypothetical protein
MESRQWGVIWKDFEINQEASYFSENDRHKLKKGADFPGSKAQSKCLQSRMVQIDLRIDRICFSTDLKILQYFLRYLLQWNVLLAEIRMRHFLTTIVQIFWSLHGEFVTKVEVSRKKQFWSSLFNRKRTPEHFQLLQSIGHQNREIISQQSFFIDRNNNMIG